MRTTTWTVALVGSALALAAVSCAKGGGGGPAAPDRSANSSPTSGGGSAKASRGDAAAPPAGAQYTIYCAAVPGDGHVPRATQLRDQLLRATGMRDWYVVHEPDQSTLYYGYYRAIERQDDPKEAARARADREKIAGLVDASGARPFEHPVLVELAAPDPDAPAEWDLRNAPRGMVWSLQIAAYEGHPDRKKYAADAVKAFRDSGVPAYYYHGETVSSVCLGAWPADAVRGELEPAYNDPNQNRSIDQIMAQPSGGDLLVVSPGLPPINKEIQTKSGKVRAVSPHLEAVDPTLLATMKSYPHHYVNGVVEGMKTKDGITGKPSLLVKIPRQADTMLAGDDAGLAVGSNRPRSAGGTDALPGLPPGVGAAGVTPRRSNDSSPNAPAPGYGRLRSLEDR